jgi:hypothetical protein
MYVKCYENRYIRMKNKEICLKIRNNVLDIHGVIKTNPHGKISFKRSKQERFCKNNYHRYSYSL